MCQKLSLGIVLVLAGAGLCAAQTPIQPAGQALRAKSILGSTVSLEGGTNVGTVADIILNEEGVVDYLVVAEGNKLVTVPWDAAKFNFERRTVTVNIPVAKFREIPTYTTDQYPNFYAPDYRVNVYRHYGITPGRERRLERRDERRP
jgi:sporulation protein YlmC with PRC-barrel domain